MNIPHAMKRQILAAMIAWPLIAAAGQTPHYTVRIASQDELNQLRPANINNRGEVAGYVVFPIPGGGFVSTAPAIIGRKGTNYLELPPPPKVNWWLGFATGINDSGEAVGFYNEPDQWYGAPVVYACLWDRQGHRYDLGEPAWAHAINNRGQIVGKEHTYVPPYQEAAILWDRGEKYNLNDCISPGSIPGALIDAFYITNNGEIYASGISFSEGFSLYGLFLLTPAHGKVE